MERSSANLDLLTATPEHQEPYCGRSSSPAGNCGQPCMLCAQGAGGGSSIPPSIPRTRRNGPGQPKETNEPCRQAGQLSATRGSRAARAAFCGGPRKGVHGGQAGTDQVPDAPRKCLILA